MRGETRTNLASESSETSSGETYWKLGVREKREGKLLDFGLFDDGCFGGGCRDGSRFGGDWRSGFGFGFGFRFGGLIGFGSSARFTAG